MRFSLVAAALLVVLALSPMATTAASGVITFTSPAPNSTLSGTQAYTIRGTVSPVQIPDTIFIQVTKQGSPTALDAQSVTMGINGTFIYKTNVGGNTQWTPGIYVISAVDSYGTSASTTFTYALTSMDPTNTSITPAQIAVPSGIRVQYTATVADTSNSPSTPSGTIAWSDGGAGGSFNGTSPSGCTLSSAGAGRSSCTVIYAPPGNGVFTIKASYLGDSDHSGSAGTSSLTAGFHPSNTSVSPNSAFVIGGNMLTLTAEVNDTGTFTTPSNPTGNVTWNDGGAGGSFSSGTCKLVPTGTGSVSAYCEVSYTISSAGGSVTITAAYSGDSVHASSIGVSMLTVSKTTTTTSTTSSTSSSTSTSTTTSSSSTTSTSSTSSSTTSTSTNSSATTSTLTSSSTTTSSTTTISSSTTVITTTSSTTPSTTTTTSTTTSTVVTSTPTSSATSSTSSSPVTTSATTTTAQSTTPSSSGSNDTLYAVAALVIVAAVVGVVLFLVMRNRPQAK